MYCGNTGGQMVLVGHEYVLWQRRWTDSVGRSRVCIDCGNTGGQIVLVGHEYVLIVATQVDR